MDPKRARKNMRKVEVPKDPPKSLTWEIQLLTYRGGGEGLRQEVENSTVTDGGNSGKNRPRTKRSESEMDTEGGGEASASIECQFRHKKGHMSNIYLTDLDEEAIADFVKDLAVLYDKTNGFPKVYLWGRFTTSHKLSVKVCKTWFESKRIHYEKINRIEVWPGFQGNDREVEKDSGQILIFGDPHQEQRRASANLQA